MTAASDADPRRTTKLDATLAVVGLGSLAAGASITLTISTQ
jgi:hypothetical protein